MAEKSEKGLVRDSSEDGSKSAVGMPGQRKAPTSAPKSIKGTAKPTKKG